MNEKDRKTGKQESGESGGAKAHVRRLLISLKNRLLHNFGWKLVSLISAFGVWMAIMNMQDPYISVTIENIPVAVLNESALQEVIVTDTIPLREDQNLSKFTVLSVADIFADVIERVHNYKEISSIFFK